MKHRRRGTTLVELLVVISLSGVMISATGVCLHGLYQVEQHVREAAIRRSAIDRLSSQFRTDAHSAVEVRLQAEDVDSEPRLEFRGSEGFTIEYYQQDQKVVRTTRQADTVLHTDAFRLGRKVAATWQIDTGQPQIVAVEVTRQSSAKIQATGQHSERIEAVVGLHASLLAGDL